MSLIESKFRVGAPFVVFLQVLNLSQEDRDLMLLMAKDEEGKSTPTSYNLLNSNNTNLAVTAAASTGGNLNSGDNTNQDLKQRLDNANNNDMSATAANNAIMHQQRQHLV